MPARTGRGGVTVGSACRDAAVFLGFLACTAFWPREPVLGFSLAAFLAHGVWSYRF